MGHPNGDDSVQAQLTWDDTEIRRTSTGPMQLSAVDPSDAVQPNNYKHKWLSLIVDEASAKTMGRQWRRICKKNT